MAEITQNQLANVVTLRRRASTSTPTDQQPYDRILAEIQELKDLIQSIMLHEDEFTNVDIPRVQQVWQEIISRNRRFPTDSTTSSAVTQTFALVDPFVIDVGRGVTGNEFTRYLGSWSLQSDSSLKIAQIGTESAEDLLLGQDDNRSAPRLPDARDSVGAATSISLAKLLGLIAAILAITSFLSLFSWISDLGPMIILNPFIALLTLGVSPFIALMAWAAARD